ncbi:hypothetical protein D3C73_1485410 [compost metagenome]
MVLPHPKGMKSDGVSQLRFLEQLAQHARMFLRVSIGVHPGVAESVQAEQDLMGRHRRCGIGGNSGHQDSFSQPASSEAQ